MRTDLPVLSPLEIAALRGLQARERVLATMRAEMRADFQALVQSVARSGHVYGVDYVFSESGGAVAAPPSPDDVGEPACPPSSPPSPTSTDSPS